MKKEIWFDLDGTLANLYGVKDWKEKLNNSDETPYRDAKPLLNLQALARLLNNLQAKGWKVNVVSWLSKNGSAEYGYKVTLAKRAWLAKHLASVKFDKVDIIDYGMPKHLDREGILFDDEEKNRLGWGEGAYDINDIIGVLKAL